jgi:hypothetical protein
MTSAVKEKRRRIYGLYYTFGPVPGDLVVLLDVDVVAFAAPDGLTRAIPASPDGFATIELYVTTKDGVDLPYRLQSLPESKALILLNNSIPVEDGMCDGFVAKSFSSSTKQLHDSGLITQMWRSSHDFGYPELGCYSSARCPANPLICSRH